MAGIRLLLLTCLVYRLASPVHAACGSISQAGPYTSGSISSHSTFGSSDYSANMNCQWTVTLPYSTRYVFVTVSSLSLGEGDCIRVLRYSDNAELTSVCNGTATGTLMSLRSTGIVQFTSDSSQQAAGFRLTLTPTTSATCSGTSYLYGSSGSLSSHFYAGSSRYNNSMTCYWYIRVPEGLIVRAGFRSASLESSYDKLYFYDSSTISSSYLINTFTGSVTSSTNSTYFTSSRYLSLYLYTDSSVTYTGFRLYFEAVNASQVTGSSSCGSISQAGNSTSGSVTSHSDFSTFGSSYYSANMNCQWIVTLPSYATYITVSVANLSLGSGDCMNIMGSSDSVVLVSVCSGTASGTLIKLMTTGIIRFSSDSSGQAAGFRLSLTPTTSTSTCSGSASIRASSGIISSHSGAGLTSYSNSLRCYWYIQVPDSEIARVWFLTASTESSHDKIRLYSSSSTSSSYLLNTISGSISSFTNRSYDSTTKYMTVYFYTDSSISRTGFRMSFQIASTATSLTWIIVGCSIGGAIVLGAVGYFCEVSQTSKKTSVSPSSSSGQTTNTAASRGNPTSNLPPQPQPGQPLAPSNFNSQPVGSQQSYPPANPPTYPPAYSSTYPPAYPPAYPPPNSATPPPSYSTVFGASGNGGAQA